MDNLPEIASPVRTRAIMEAYNLTLKKSLGQNFLTDLNILKKIVTAADICRDDNVIEVGPGIGALTEQLAKKAHSVLAIEIDQRLVPILKETLLPYNNVKIEHGDILKSDLKKILEKNFEEKPNIKLVANLPYYITTPIIMHLLASKIDFERIVVMMQKEVANRLAASPNTKDYGSLSVAVQYSMDVEIAFVVPKSVFIPQPKVDSAIVVLKKHAKKYNPKSEEEFKKLVRIAFKHRRKSLWNNLLKAYGKKEDVKESLKEALNEAEILPNVRAEKLSISDFVRLSDTLIKFF